MSLVQHLHDFARDVRLTGEEWFTAMDFLERVGKISTPTRQEVMLLSAIFWASACCWTGSTRTAGRRSPRRHYSASSTSRAGRPPTTGTTSTDGVSGTPMFVTGRVVDDQGKPIGGAHVDTWHSDGEGYYDVQQTEKLHDDFAMRAAVELPMATADSEYWRDHTPLLSGAHRGPVR